MPPTPAPARSRAPSAALGEPFNTTVVFTFGVLAAIEEQFGRSVFDVAGELLSLLPARALDADTGQVMTLTDEEAEQVTSRFRVGTAVKLIAAITGGTPASIDNKVPPERLTPLVFEALPALAAAVLQLTPRKPKDEDAGEDDAEPADSGGGAGGRELPLSDASAPGLSSTSG